MGVSQEQVAQFSRDGYLPVGQVLSAAELAEARAAYDQIFAATEKPGSYRNLGQKEGEEQSAGAVLQIINMYELADIFRRLVAKDETLDMVEALLGTPTIQLYHDQALFKPPLHGDEVPWHQDNGYWRFEPPTAISLWVALDDADETNGCMRFVPGSHKAGEAGHKRAGEYVALLKADADDALAVAVPVAAGHGVFHHCRTLHNTQPNRSERQRRAWVRHYTPLEITQKGEPVRRLVVRGAVPAGQ